MSVKFHTNIYTHTHSCSLEVDTQTAKKRTRQKKKNIYKHLLLSKYLFKIKMCQTVIMGHLNSTPKVYLTLNMYLRDIFCCVSSFSADNDYVEKDTLTTFTSL